MQPARAVVCIGLLAAGVASPPQTTITSARVDIDHDGDLETVSVAMSSGRRYDDDQPWCGRGEKYEGSFVVAVDHDGGRVETALDPLFGGGPLWFPAPTGQLVLVDYNGDGDVEFNLGQYGSCNGWRYRMLSVRASGEVVAVSPEFRVGDFVASTTEIEQIERGFRATYWDNGRGGNWEVTFRWNPEARLFEKESERRVDGGEIPVRRDGEHGG